MSMSHEHAVCGGMHPRQGKGNAIQGLALVCLWRSVGECMVWKQSQLVGRQAGSPGFCLGPSDAGKKELHVLGRTYPVELKEGN